LELKDGTSVLFEGIILSHFEDAKMTKLLLSAALAALFLSAPANAAMHMKCDDASMTKMQTDMDAMKDPAMKANMEMAMKQMGMAKTAMKDKKMGDCSMHMGMADMSMKMKCDDDSMMIMQKEIDAMVDPAKKPNKDMAMKHMGLAKTSMKDSKPDECMMHMGEAMDAMNEKM
jgi:hypothetical protein